MIVIALDIDGVLASYSNFFLGSIPAWQKAGMKVGILTGRSESGKEKIAEILTKFGIKMDFLIFKPDELDKIPNGIWKAAMCRIMKVDLLFDDMEHNDPVFVSDFMQTIGDTQIFTPISYKDQPDAHDNTTKDYVDKLVEILEGKKK